MEKETTKQTIRKKLVASVEELNPLEISQEDFDKLLEYSRSLPTGQHEGKKWKCNLHWYYQDEEPVWAIYEYGKTFMDGAQLMRDIKHYKPIITQ